MSNAITTTPGLSAPAPIRSTGLVRMPSIRFTHENSARRNMMADPFMPTDTGWEMETGWEVIGWCENPPACYRNKVERFYVGLMLQAPDGNDYWWHWMLARGEKAITDWRDSEWPTARHPNAEVSHAVGVGSTDWLGKPSENLTKTTNT